MGPDLVARRDCAVTLKWRPSGTPGAVQVAGEFSDWATVDMADDDGDGVWEADLGEVAPGEYGYKHIVDGVWEGEPPVSAYTKWSDGVENRNLRVGDCGLPLIQVVSAEAAAETTIKHAREARFTRAQEVLKSLTDAATALRNFDDTFRDADDPTFRKKVADALKVLESTRSTLAGITRDGQ